MTIIAIDGVIGAGKTTLLNKIINILPSKYPNKNIVKIIEYPADTKIGNEKLKKYIKGEMNSYEFQNLVNNYYEKILDMSKFLYHKDRIEIHDRWGGCIIPFVNALFKVKYINDYEKNKLINKAKNIMKEFNKLDLIILNIKCSFETMIINIKNRNRDDEDKYDIQYLKILFDEYKIYIDYLKKEGYNIIEIENEDSADNLIKNSIIEIEKLF